MTMSGYRPSSYLHPLLQPVNGSSGRSIIAIEDLPSGMVVAVWGGTMYDSDGFNALPHARQQISVQVEETLFLVPEIEGPAEWFNHSCEPNAGMMGQIALSTLRPVARGEEIRYDYAMSDGSPYDEFECGCGAARCRGRVTGNDWCIPQLWNRYDGHFSPYLQRRIDLLRSRIDREVEQLPEGRDLILADALNLHLFSGETIDYSHRRQPDAR